LEKIRFVWFRFVSIGFVSFRLISFRFVSFLFRFALYMYPINIDRKFYWIVPNWRTLPINLRIVIKNMVVFIRKKMHTNGFCLFCFLGFARRIFYHLLRKTAFICNIDRAWMIYRKHPIRSLWTSMLRKANIRYPSDVCQIKQRYTFHLHPAFIE
jgi:hypothetical protein